MPLAKGETRHLLARIAQQDERALAELWSHYVAPINAIGQRFLGSHAEGEEVVQDTFAKIWDRAGRFDPAKGRGRAWVFAVARNVARDRLRRQRLRWVAGLEELPVEPADPTDSVEDTLASRQKLRDLEVALLDLPDTQRMALLLASVGDLETPEISEILGKSRGSVEQLIVRARRRLRVRMEEMGHG